MTFNHVPVLLNECIEGLNIKQNGIYVDCTLGLGGHSIEIAKRLKCGKLIAIDQDISAIEISKQNLSDYLDRIIFVHDNFSNINNILDNLNIDFIDGVIMDIGVSSMQIDNPERGFSYMKDAILDMRMDESIDIDAKKVVNTFTKSQLVDIFSRYGEERKSKTIANKILDYRKQKTINTTFELRDIIRSVSNSKELHPEKRVFQALRIYVNDELSVLSSTLDNILDRMNSGARICVITFHSLEDRIVKEKFIDFSKSCTCPSTFPVCICNHQKKLNIINKKPILSTPEEVNINSRSKSAKLRIAQRI